MMAFGVPKRPFAVRRVEECEECTRLWDKFITRTYRVVQLKGRVQFAILARDQERERLLVSQLRQAEQAKMDGQIVLERHEVEAHGIRTRQPPNAGNT